MKAFGGVHPKKHWLDFNLVSVKPLNDKRITKVEQVSKNRYHNNFRFTAVNEIDKNFVSLLKQSYELMKQ